MERIDPESERPSIVEEHKHRYQVAASVAFGDILDCACGLGYGSKILLGQSLINSYTGIDISQDAINIAAARYKDPRISFKVADATRLPFPDNSFDTIVSLETLEHLLEPTLVVQEFVRVLKPGGILLASAPTTEHDNYCENAFGKNTHHHTRFTRESFERLLSTVGQNKVYLSRIVTAAELSDNSKNCAYQYLATLPPLGSFIGVARKGGEPPLLLPLTRPLLNLVEVEAEITKAYDRIVKDRDGSIAGYQMAEAELREALSTAETMAIERLKTIDAYAQADAELRAAFKRAEEMIQERDAVILKFKALESELQIKLLRLEELLDSVKTNDQR